MLHLYPAADPNSIPALWQIALTVWVLFSIIFILLVLVEWRKESLIHDEAEPDTEERAIVYQSIFDQEDNEEEE